MQSVLRDMVHSLLFIGRKNAKNELFNLTLNLALRFSVLMQLGELLHSFLSFLFFARSGATFFLFLSVSFNANSNIKVFTGGVLLLSSRQLSTVSNSLIQFPYLMRNHI